MQKIKKTPKAPKLELELESRSVRKTSLDYGKGVDLVLTTVLDVDSRVIEVDIHDEDESATGRLYVRVTNTTGGKWAVAEVAYAPQNYCLRRVILLAGKALSWLPDVKAALDQYLEDLEYGHQKVDGNYADEEEEVPDSDLKLTEEITPWPKLSAMLAPKKAKKPQSMA